MSIYCVVTCPQLLVHQGTKTINAGYYMYARKDLATPLSPGFMVKVSKGFMSSYLNYGVGGDCRRISPPATCSWGGYMSSNVTHMVDNRAQESQHGETIIWKWETSQHCFPTAFGWVYSSPDCDRLISHLWSRIPRGNCSSAAAWARASSWAHESYC